MGSAEADRPWAPGLSPSCPIISPWADWQDEWEQMAHMWLRGLPAQPLSSPHHQGLLGSGLGAWPGPECMSICVYQRPEGRLGVETLPREDLLSCSWEGSPGDFLALRHPSGQDPTG